jgi:hypothetical protein
VSGIIILRMCEYGVLRRVFGPKREEATGVWRKLHETPCNLYFVQMLFD